MATTSIPTAQIIRIDAESEDLGYLDPSEDHRPQVGDRGYLIRTTTRGVDRWDIRDNAGHTNLSGEPLVWGWLGQTNDVYQHAEGYVEVVHAGPRVTRVREIEPVAHGGQTMSPDEHLAELATDLREARASERAAADSLRAAVRDAHAADMSRYRIQQVTALAPETVKAWTA